MGGLKTAGLLAGLGSGMVKTGEHVWQQMRDEAEAMKQENLLRLQNKLSDDSKIAAEKREMANFPEKARLETEAKVAEQAALAPGLLDLETQKTKIQTDAAVDQATRTPANEGKTTYDQKTGEYVTYDVRGKELRRSKEKPIEVLLNEQDAAATTMAAQLKAKGDAGALKAADINVALNDIDLRSTPKFLKILEDKGSSIQAQMLTGNDGKVDMGRLLTEVQKYDPEAVSDYFRSRENAMKGMSAGMDPVAAGGAGGLLTGAENFAKNLDKIKKDLGVTIDATTAKGLSVLSAGDAVKQVESTKKEPKKAAELFDRLGNGAAAAAIRAKYGIGLTPEQQTSLLTDDAKGL